MSEDFNTGAAQLVGLAVGLVAVKLLLNDVPHAMGLMPPKESRRTGGHYVVRLEGGFMSIERASSEEEARRVVERDLRERYGPRWRDQVRIASIAPATPRDVEWYRSMGGSQT